MVICEGLHSCWTKFFNHLISRFNRDIYEILIRIPVSIVNGIIGNIMDCCYYHYYHYPTGSLLVTKTLQKKASKKYLPNPSASQKCGTKSLFKWFTTGLNADWLVGWFFRHVNLSRASLYLEVRESCRLYVYIYIGLSSFLKKIRHMIMWFQVFLI